MALNIKDPETDRLARELAAATGETITVAARRALEERLRRVRAQTDGGAARLRVKEVIARARTRSQVSADTRSDDEILGYDDNGIPSR